jgi:hypothetical protein
MPIPPLCKQYRKDGIVLWVLSRDGVSMTEENEMPVLDNMFW